MTSFQRLCWTWSRVYDLIFRFIKTDSSSLLLRYEDLFLARNREIYFRQLLDFLSNFDDKRLEYEFYPNLLDKRVNSAGRDFFPNWRHWDGDLAKQLNEICGSQMAKFGYGNEPEWLEKIGT